MISTTPMFSLFRFREEEAIPVRFESESGLLDSMKGEVEGEEEE